MKQRNKPRFPVISTLSLSLTCFSRPLGPLSALMWAWIFATYAANMLLRLLTCCSLPAFCISFAVFMHFFYLKFLIRLLHGFRFYLCIPFLFCFPFLIFSKLLSSFINHLAKLFTELHKSFLSHLFSRVDSYPNSSFLALMATSRAVKDFVHKSGEVGFSKYTHVVYHTWLQYDWADRLCRQALSWGITLWDYGGSAALRSLVPYCEVENINLLPLKLSKQEEQFKFREF